jgi:hypothetical protein
MMKNLFKMDVELIERTDRGRRFPYCLPRLAAV